MQAELAKTLSLVSTYLDEVNRVYPSIARLHKMMKKEIPCDKILFVGSARSVNYMNDLYVLLKYTLIPNLDKAKIEDYDYPKQYKQIQNDVISSKNTLDKLFEIIIDIRNRFAEFGNEAKSDDIPIYIINKYLKKIGCE